MNIEINGEEIASEELFHNALVKALDLSSYYGRNLDALSDVLSVDVERPLILTWNDSARSRSAMGSRFDLIVEVLRQIEKQDIEIGYDEKFELHLR